MIKFIFIFIFILNLNLFALENNDLKNQAINQIENYQTNQIQVFFSPKGNCEDVIIYYINNAKQSIEIAMYNLTNPKIINSIISALKRGIKITIYCDKSMTTNKYLQLNSLKNILKIKYDNHKGLMHNKFAIFDNQIVITGSYNWTKNAENFNDENLLVIDSQKISERYENKFKEFVNG